MFSRRSCSFITVSVVFSSLNDVSLSCFFTAASSSFRSRSFALSARSFVSISSCFFASAFPSSNTSLDRLFAASTSASSSAMRCWHFASCLLSGVFGTPTFSLLFSSANAFHLDSLS